MEIDNCKNCEYCTTFYSENNDGEYITLYCWKPKEKECPYKE